MTDPPFLDELFSDAIVEGSVLGDVLKGDDSAPESPAEDGAAPDAGSD